MVKILVTFLILILNLTLAEATTYYVRPQGGTRAQCTGTTDANYPGSGTGKPCAFNNPMWLLGVVSSKSLPSLMKGGDTLFIHSGSYKIGYDTQFTPSYCGQASAFDCRPRPIPSGSFQARTKILGETSLGKCTAPPELWGTERVATVLDMNGSSYVDISCLEITDHSSCRQGGPASNRCFSGPSFPKGPWGQTGIVATASQNVTLTDVNIHGLASYGLWTGRLTNWQMLRVKINGQGQAGWHGERIPGNSSNSGTIILKNSEVRWNGCAENYPIGTSPVVGSCCSQNQGCYSDGIGMADSGGNYIIEDSNISFNAEDGVDLLHVTLNPPTSIIVRRNRVEGNAGNGIKTGATNVRIENNILISGCSYLEDASFVAPGWSNSCRAGGENIGIDVQANSHHKIYNNTMIQTVATKNMTIAGKVQGAVCNGTEDIVWSNNITMGGRYSQYNDVQDCAGWSSASIKSDHNLVYHAYSGCLPAGSGNICSDPQFVNARDFSYFPGMTVYLKNTSPAIDKGNSQLQFSDSSRDYYHRSRTSPWDMGAIKF